MGHKVSDVLETTVKQLEQVADLAYQRWENEGRPSGRNLDLWAWAEAQILAGQNLPVVNPPASVPVYSQPVA
jgi:hypothetical protein